MCLFLTAHGCKKPNMVVVPPPGTTAVNNVVDYLKNQLNLSLFSSLVEKSGLTDSISKAEVTVLAVDNIGFNNYGIYSPNDFNKWSVDSINRFVRTHIISGRIFYDEIPRSLDIEYKSINNEKLLISYFPKNVGENQDPSKYGAIYACGARFIPNPKVNEYDGLPKTYGTALTNGLVYVLETSIKTSSINIQDFIQNNPNFSILKAGLQKFGIWDKLKNNNQITLLAPPDSVFRRHHISKETIENMDLAHTKSLFMDSYLNTFNRVFTSDIQNFVNSSKFTTPFANPTIWLSNTSDPNIGFVMCPIADAGVFLYDNRIDAQMENHTGGQIWFKQLFGSNINSKPVWDDPNSGYNIPFLNEFKYVSNDRLKGTYINYNCSNGVVHMINGLLLTPDQAKK